MKWHGHMRISFLRRSIGTKIIFRETVQFLVKIKKVNAYENLENLNFLKLGNLYFLILMSLTI